MKKLVSIKLGSALLVVILMASCGRENFDDLELTPRDNQSEIQSINPDLNGDDLAQVSGDGETFDCEELSLNIGDDCSYTYDGVEYEGVVNSDCLCSCGPGGVEYDCPDLQAMIGGWCYTEEGYPGTTTEECDCEVNEDYCVELSSSVGESCVSADGVFGVTTEDCECEAYDCEWLFGNIGDPCEDVNWDTGDWYEGTITEDCECE